FVGERSKNGEERHGEQQGHGNNDKGSAQIHLQNRLQIEQGIVLARVTDHALSCRGPQQRDQEELEVRPLREGFLQRLCRAHARALELRKDRRLLHLEANVKRDDDQDDGNQEGNAPSVALEICRRHVELEEDHSDDGKKQPQRSGNLYITSPVAPSFVGNVFGNINCRPAILPSQRQSLKDS